MNKSELGGILLIILICACIFIPKYQPEETETFLSNQGYTNIEITGWRPFMGGQDDFYCTGFKAVNPNGVTISGAVTSGFFKGKTIRFDD